MIADDQEPSPPGAAQGLEIEPDTTVVGEAADGEQAVQVATRLQPDVVLMDIRMPSLDGIEATRRLVRTHPSIRVLMLTTFGLDTYVYESLRAGASEFMLKDAPPEEIAAAVRIIAGGDALLAPSVTRSVIEQFARQPQPHRPNPRWPSRPNPRERDVLDLLVAGLSSPEICDRLFISDATAKTHVARILQKLGLRDRVQVVIYAYESGFIQPGTSQGEHLHRRNDTGGDSSSAPKRSVGRTHLGLYAEAKVSPQKIGWDHVPDTRSAESRTLRSGR